MAMVTLNAVEYAAKPSSTGWLVVLKPPNSSTLSVESGVPRVAKREMFVFGEVRERSLGFSVVGSFRGFSDGSLGNGGSSSTNL